MGQGRAETRGAGPTAWAPREYGAQRSQAMRNPMAGQRMQMRREMPEFPGQGRGVAGGFPGQGGPFGGGMRPRHSQPMPMPAPGLTPAPPQHSQPMPLPQPQMSGPIPMPQLPPQAMGGGFPQQMPPQAFVGDGSGYGQEFRGMGPQAPNWLPPMLQRRG